MAAIDTRVVTGIRFYKESLKVLNSMTFIYDPAWSINNSAKATLPVCFFHVKGQHEAMSSEISQKQMLFYNSSEGANNSDAALNSGLLNVVADNIVIKPKVYRLDVVIPYSNLTLLFNSFVYNTHTQQAIFSALIKNAIGQPDNWADRLIGSYSTLSTPVADLLKAVIKTLRGANFNGLDVSNIDTLISNITGTSSFNKESIETMWRMRRILKMKVWNSWGYRYVSIVDMDITKEGTEDGVFEATLTLQEMPIVSMYAQGKKNVPVYTRKNPMLEASGKAAINTLDFMGGYLNANRTK